MPTKNFALLKVNFLKIAEKNPLKQNYDHTLIFDMRLKLLFQLFCLICIEGTLYLSYK